MEIEFEKHIGDKVWLMFENQVVSGQITEILYRKYVSNVDYETIFSIEKYNVEVKDSKYKNGSKTISCEKGDIFPDKESLIKSL